MTITSNEAYSLCAYVDGGAVGQPPAPWTLAWSPATVSDDNYALVLQQTVGGAVLYALVIQGTKNAIDAIEDFNVEFQVAFPWVSGGQISAGSLDAMNKLLVLVDNGGT